MPEDLYRHGYGAGFGDFYFQPTGFGYKPNMETLVVGVEMR